MSLDCCRNMHTPQRKAKIRTRNFPAVPLKYVVCKVKLWSSILVANIRHKILHFAFILRSEHMSSWTSGFIKAAAWLHTSLSSHASPKLFSGILKHSAKQMTQTNINFALHNFPNMFKDVSIWCSSKHAIKHPLWGRFHLGIWKKNYLAYGINPILWNGLLFLGQ